MINDDEILPEGFDPAASKALDAGRLTEVHAELRDDPAYQFDTLTVGELEPPSWLQAISDLIASLLRAMRPVLEVIFWLGLALIVAGIVYVILREIIVTIKMRRSSQREEEPIRYQPTSSKARALLVEADAAAAKGDYAQAVHVLLHKSVEDLDKQYPFQIRVSQTAREISRLNVLTPLARNAFLQIASAVERSHFAGRIISKEIFIECREAYAAFVEPEEAFS